MDINLIAVQCPEVELLLCCARVQIDQGISQRIITILQQEIDWEKLLQLASRHRMMPLLSQNLNVVCPDLVPPIILSRLKHSFQKTVQNNLLLTKELLKLLKLFDINHMPAIPYKGVILAVSVYQNLGLRQFADLDIWMPITVKDQAIALLRSQGYELSKDLNWEMDFTHHSTDICIDLHWELMPEHFSFALDFDQVRSRLTPFFLGGTTVFQFSSEDLFLLLCVQLSKDCCTCQQLKLAQICDIAELLRTTPQMDWDWILGQAKTLEIQRIVRLAMSLLNKVLDISPPEEIRQWCYADAALDAIAVNAYIKLWDQPPLYPEKVPTDDGFWLALWEYDHRFYLSMRESFSNRAKYCLYWFRYILYFMFAPNQTDYDLFSLPKALFFLYYPVHVFRVITKNIPSLIRRLRGASVAI